MPNIERLAIIWSRLNQNKNLYCCHFFIVLSGMEYNTGLADKSEQQVNPNGSLGRAFLYRFQSIWFHNMKDWHHFYLLTKAGFKIWWFNKFPMLLSLPVHFALRKTAGDNFCGMTSSLELWDRKCQIYPQQSCKNRKSSFPREER